MESVRVYEIQNCKMVSSGIGMFGEEKFDRFDKWFSSQQRTTFPRDYLFWDGEWQVSGGFHWLYVYEEGMNVPEEFDIIDFKGGLYAVVTGIDQQSNSEEMKAVHAFIESHGFEIDRSRPELGNIITPPSARDAMGYNQMDYFTPIRIKVGQ
ncbi:AraC family transcriptional regulator [Paenibacillus sp. Marseille-P2973]|uniref:AraC family transcriptional regulator n=1 Tax=Paenibacillus TaxID=44249 RepID=UPI001B35FDDB|nr:AraC family transcriptional regulator [Paenibacillus vini]MBQ4901540.1 AraC family transcriptional regulator [Paenibacillus sp. Marseille-P2973]MDN4070083.1 AraC family transcriptional regulator [Paenibacillus vini]